MSDDPSLPVLIAQPSAFDTGMIAGLRRQIAELTACHEASRHFVAAMQQTIDTQRALIEELTAERDEWQQVANDTLAKHGRALVELHRALNANSELAADRDAWRDKAQRHATECTTVHHVARPPFPQSALTGGDGRPTW